MKRRLTLEMHRLRFLPDIRLIQKPDTGYPPLKSGIRPDSGYKKRPDYSIGLQDIKCNLLNTLQ
jgi:hypothetical protein